jgi:hypothetical protein
VYTGLTAEICQRAWDIVKASVIAAANNGVTKRLAGTIVVLDPHTGMILFSASVNDDHPDAEKYDAIAMAKANLCWKHKMSSREIQQTAPHLYEEGDVKWGGGVYEFGLVDAFSGVQAVLDEAIAWSMLAWIMALCQHEMTRPLEEGGVMASDYSFIGGDFAVPETPSGITGWRPIGPIPGAET